MKEIYTLWDKVGERSGELGTETGKRAKAGKGLAAMPEPDARPRNVAVRDLLGNELFTEAVIDFQRNAKVGMGKEGVLDKR